MINFKNVSIGSNAGVNDKVLRDTLIRLEQEGKMVISVVQELNQSGYPIQWKIFYR
jgi:hypothetical protein